MVDINVVIRKLNNNGMDKIKFYSDLPEDSSWLEFMKDTLKYVEEALKAIKLGVDLSRTQMFFGEFEREIRAAKTNEDAFEYAIEYAIMGFSYDSWLLNRRKFSAHCNYIKLEVFA